ncbi:UvrD-helicase domain-containing protein [Streptomyces rochei]|uniref:UvrD-helicase domain-containing protein n=1 Tax=Streptomyces TaxID=1883 RepID=UPI00249CCD89|nr:UvrD-helicase domain-containing protein [Streptomyces sp. AN-3]MDI3095919.1 3'-5' exonuclease [Streptomyces sp. AN-3]
MNYGAGRPGNRVRTRVRVEPQAHGDLERRDRAVADAVVDFVRRLRADRTNRALRLSPLRKAGDDADLCLAQPDPRCMVLVLVTDGGDEMRVLAVRDGTRARDELARLTVEINPVSGAVEVVDQTEADATVVSLRGRATPLFASYDDQTLLDLGVVRSLLPALREITSDEQFKKLLTHNLPQLTRDVLLALREGVSAEDVRRHITDTWRADEEVDPRDWARAARRAVSRAETDDDAVLGALGRSFDAWRLFLHPEQQRLATGDFKGSAKVTGGPGTGKTVVALHRVRHLVDRLPPGHSRPVLLTTYNTNLALELTERLRQLGGDELLRRVDVRSVDALALAVVEESRSEVGRPLDDDAAMNLWHTVRYETDLLDYDADFLDAEFKHVVLANRCGTWDAYRRVGRSGRPRISTAQRHEVWQLVQAYRAQLDGTPRRTTYALIADRAAELEQRRMARIEEQARYKEEEQRGRDLVHREAGSGMWLTPRYRHIVVDEAQDLSAAHWRMLRAMVRRGPNDIFLAGDAHQRIYGSRVVLGHQGIEIRGRASRRLTLNYRTTRQILGSANRLIEGATFDDLDTGTDSLDGYRSVLTGLAPQFWRAPDRLTEMRAVATLIKERHELHRTAYSAMAVSVPDGAAAQEFANVLLREFGLPVVELGRRGVSSEEDAVRIGTMHRFKGLEFQRVFLTSVGEGQVPHQRIEQYRYTNPDRYRQEEQRARSLVFVAATRARDELVVTWSGRASRFLPPDADRTAHRATDLLASDGPPSGSSGSAAA